MDRDKARKGGRGVEKEINGYSVMKSQLEVA